MENVEGEKYHGPAFSKEGLAERGERTAPRHRGTLVGSVG